MNNMNIYQMNDFDWVCAHDNDEAIKVYELYCKQVGMSDSDIDREDIIILSEEELNKYLYEYDDDGNTITFKEELRLREKPGFFASTEY